MTSYSSCLVLLMLVCNSYTRSLNPHDVSVSPKKPSRMQPPANAAAYDIFSLANDNENAIEESMQQESKQTPVSSAIDSPMPILSKQSENPQPLPVIKFNSFMKASQGGDRQGKHVITPDLVKANTVRPGEDASTGGSTIISTKVPVVTTTTEDPWDAFCSEACQEGLAGPECDCAEHPIGRRHAPSPSLFYDMGQRP